MEENISSAIFENSFNNNYANLSNKNSFHSIQDNIGLIEGLTGQCLLMFMNSKKESNVRIYEMAWDLLTKIADKSSCLIDHSFENGMAGVGWAVEWIVQNKFSEHFNTDEVLTPIDKELYKKISSGKRDVSLFTGILGYLTYFYLRAISENAGTHRYRRIVHSECLFLLAEGIDSVLNNNAKNIRIKSTELARIILTFSSLSTWYHNKIIFKSILSKSINIAEGRLATSSEPPWDLLYLAIAYFIVGEDQKNFYWTKRAHKYIEKQYVSTKSLNKDTDPVKAAMILALFNHNFPNDLFKNELKVCMSKFQDKELSFSLCQGVGSIALVNMCLSQDDLVRKWHEVFFIK